MRTLTVSVFNRPGYTRELVDALSACAGVGGYRVFFLCDRPDGSEACDEVVDIVRGFGACESRVFVHGKRLGCNGNVFSALSLGFRLSDFHVHLEDDCIPGVDFLSYMGWCGGEFAGCDDVFSVSGYTNAECVGLAQFFPRSRDLGGVGFRRHFSPWGWGSWRRSWSEMCGGWLFTDTVDLSWDLKVDRYVRGDRAEVFPFVARVRDVGAVGGVHVPSAEWHARFAFNDYWVGSVGGYSGGFRAVF